MPAKWIDAYLARIGYDGAREVSSGVLAELHERHMQSVPFENLDIAAKTPIVVDPDRFVEKIVTRRRGGFCYELNGAFAALLRELGFDVTLLSGRVVNEEGGFGPPFDHLALLVELPDASRWLADVGFGQSFVRPLRLEPEIEQHDRTGTYRLLAGDEWQMQVRRDEQWATEYRFDLEPRRLAEFAGMCEWQQTSPQSSFTRRRICTRATEWGRVTLTDGRLITSRNGTREERPVSDAEWEGLLREMFGFE